MFDPIYPLQPPIVQTEMTPPRQPALTVREVPPTNRFTVQSSSSSTTELTRRVQTALPRYIQKNLEQEKMAQQKKTANCCDCIVM